jgi:hypothetical protein
LNEFLPAPAAFDWDGDAIKDALDEWIELTNLGTQAVDIGGWYLDDAPSGSLAFRVPFGTVLQPGAYAIYYRRTTGIDLDDHGDQVRLLDASGTLVDLVTFGTLGVDQSYGRDSAGAWHVQSVPSPRAANGSVTAAEPPGIGS